MPLSPNITKERKSYIEFKSRINDPIIKLIEYIERIIETDSVDDVRFSIIKNELIQIIKNL